MKSLHSLIKSILPASILAVLSLHAHAGTSSNVLSAGAGSGKPDNRTIIVSIFNDATNRSKRPSEQQTVSISNGSISMSLGNGRFAEIRVHNAKSKAAAPKAKSSNTATPPALAKQNPAPKRTKASPPPVASQIPPPGRILSKNAAPGSTAKAPKPRWIAMPPGKSTAMTPRSAPGSKPPTRISPASKAFSPPRPLSSRPSPKKPQGSMGFMPLDD